MPQQGISQQELVQMLEAMGATWMQSLKRLVEDSELIRTSTAVPGLVGLGDGRLAQCFVVLSVFDPELLEKAPETGGLLENRSLVEEKDGE